MRSPVRRFTPPRLEGFGPEAGYYTWDVVAEESILLVEATHDEEDQKKRATAERKAQELWAEHYEPQTAPFDPSDNVEIRVLSNIRSDFESIVVATAEFAVLQMTLFHARKHSIYYMDGLGEHGASDLNYAFADKYSDHDGLRGVSPVDVLWVDGIESDNLEENTNRIAELLIHLRDDFVCDGVVAMEQSRFFDLLPGFERIEKYLYYGDFIELQTSQKHRPMR